MIQFVIVVMGAVMMGAGSSAFIFGAVLLLSAMGYLSK